MTMYKKVVLPAAVLWLALSSAPANAQFSWTNWQVPVGPVRIKENDIEKQLFQGYLSGLISSQEFADLKKDLDGIRVQEERYRADNFGICPWAEKHLMAKLDFFKMVIDSHFAANQSVAAVTVTPR